MSSDPALETEEDGRNALQKRLVVYAKTLLAIDLGYWPVFQLIWRRDPAVGAARAWQHTLSAPSIALVVLYLALWFIARGRPRKATTSRALDLATSASIGVIFAGLLRSHPNPVVSTFEVLLALTGVLAVRALLVPSSVRRTLAAGLATCAPPVMAALADPARFGGGVIPPTTLAFVVLNWCGVAVAFSTVASAMLYGLRRQVRDARRLGQYTLLEKLGEGGMGAVYLARHAMLRRPTAIKLLPGRQAVETLERFEQEVQLMAQLTHPNTVAVHDYGRTDDGTFYYAMDYLEGLDLERLVALDGAQPAARVIHIVRQVCGSLAEAHGHGLIHRDVKPANIFLCRRRGDPDMVKVLDFGLVKDLAAPTSNSLTGVNHMVGTPLYLSPETITDPRGVDGRSDLYALGATAYFLLTGQTVFKARTMMEVCADHLHTPPVPPSERSLQPVPADLEAVIMRCLAKNPADRFASAAEMLTALDACADARGWTNARADQWWEARRERIARLQQEARRPPRAPQTAETVCVDCSQRAIETVGLQSIRPA